MDLLPFGNYQACPKCGAGFGGPMGTDVVSRYCVGNCVPNGYGDFVNAKTIAEPDHPHLHQKCDRCGFVWLEHTRDATRSPENEHIEEISNSVYDLFGLGKAPAKPS